MVSCAIYAIGNELLQGSIVDTNSAFIGGRLNQIGFDVREIRLLPDDRAVLVETLASALSRYDLIAITGGLGPTFDDITAEAVSKATDRACVFNEEAYQHIERLLTSRNVTIKDSHRKQAHLPADSVLFYNAVGTAYGFAVDTGNSVIVSLPGVPYEMHPMVDVHVIPFLKKRFEVRQRYSDVLRFAGIPESDVDEEIRQIGLPLTVQCIINASKGEILVRLRSTERDDLSLFEESLRERLQSSFISSGDENAASVLVRLLKNGEETLAVAESLTGGQIGQAITSVSGASDVFIGGLIVYSNWAKIRLLEVPQDIIKKNGPVSYECAIAMVRNVVRKFETDASISVTGIAGPSGGSADNPLGTVYIGLQYRDRLKVKRFLFSGDREGIRERTVMTAITQLIRLIGETRQNP